MLNKNFGGIIAGLAIVALIMPTMAFAHGGNMMNDIRDSKNSRDEKRSESARQDESTFGVRLFGGVMHHKDEKGKHNGWYKFKHSTNKLIGTVTSTSEDELTVKIGDKTFAVNVSDAKFIDVATNTTINIGDVEVGDKVHVAGSMNDGTIDATTVYVLSVNLKPAVEKGTVESVSDDSLQLLTDSNTEITVNTNDDTKVIDENHDSAELSDIEADSQVKVWGFWDSVLNVFTAIKIKLWS